MYTNKIDSGMTIPVDNNQISFTDHKQGLMWIADSTGQLRYADKDGYDQWLQQLPTGVGTSGLTRGTPVYIDTNGKIHRALGNTTDKCIGLLLEPYSTSDVNKKLHIQTNGLFDFSFKTSYSGFQPGDKVFIDSNGGFIVHNNKEELYSGSNIKYIGTMVTSSIICISVDNYEKAPFDSTKFIFGCRNEFTGYNGPLVGSFLTNSAQIFKCSITNLNYTSDMFTSEDYVIVQQGDNRAIFSKNGDVTVDDIKVKVKFTSTELLSMINSITSKLKEIGTGKDIYSELVDNTYFIFTKDGVPPTYITLSDNLKEHLLYSPISSGNVESLKDDLGKIGIADVRFSGKQDIAGVFEPNSLFDISDSGSKAIFVREGIVSYSTSYSGFFNDINVGDKLYLGTNGRLVTQPPAIYNKIIQIGTYVGYNEIDKTYKILVDCSSKEFAHATTSPVGFRRVCYGTHPRPGYLLMDGKTPISASLYPKLFSFLKDEGTITAETTVLPEFKTLVDGDGDSHYYEIKYTDEGLSDIVPDFPYKTWTGQFVSQSIGTNGLYEATVFPTHFDVSSLVGVINDNDVLLNNFDIRLYVNLDKTNVTDDWVELKNGYFKIDGTTYGFEWKLNKLSDVRYEIVGDSDIGDGGAGIQYIAGSGETTISLVGYTYKVIITLRRLFQREFDIGFIDRAISNRVTSQSTLVNNVSSSMENTNVISTTYNLSKTADADIVFGKNNLPSATVKAGNFIQSSLASLKRVYDEKIIGTKEEVGGDISGLQVVGSYTQRYGASDFSQNIQLGTHSVSNFTISFGSALQAIHEMPLAIWQYKTDDELSYKKKIGVIVERIKGLEKNIISNTDHTRQISNTLSYSYSDSELKSISGYADSLIDDTDSGLSTGSAIGMLLKAVSETQDRLLSLETSTFGTDASTIPGGKALVNGVEKPINIPDTDINATSTILGSNRLVRALSKEIFGVANPYNTNEFDTSNNTPVSRLDNIGINLYGRKTPTGVNTDNISDFDIFTVSSSTYPYTIKAGSTGTGILSKASTTGADLTGVTTFNGVGDAINRITLKLNQLTKDVNGSDNINANRSTTSICTYTWTTPTSL